MIPYASCMCFREESGGQWKIISAQRGTSLVIGLNKRCQSIKYNVAYADRAAVGYRSRQPVITRIIDRSLLDDTYSGVTEVLLSKCNSWSFNTFNLDVSTGGRSLSNLLVHLFQQYGFVHHFRLDIVKVWHCFNLMEAAYHRHNPYHNSVHAADVTQAMHCFLREHKFSAHLTPLETMSSVLAAVAHDLDHPGVTQAFLVATSNHLVNLYNNSSVLENHHWRTAVSCLSESGIFSHMEKEKWLDIQKQLRSLILATDITRQKEFLSRFKDYLSSDSLDMQDSQYRHFALQIALKCADLCNPCRPWTISQRWSYQVCQEFYRQGAYERQLKLPLTPTFDCSRTKVAKIQADFFQFVVSPLFETWDHFLQTPFSNMLLENLKHNFNQWQQRILLQQSATERKIPVITIETPSDASPETQEFPKQHRSKSDSGLIPPKVHMETYSSEELHPSTTLLSLSSMTNTVQLRQVYAATQVESHLICPTVFQPSPTDPLECPNGCCTPILPSKQRSHNFKHYSSNRRASDFGFQIYSKLCTTQDKISNNELTWTTKIPPNENTANNRFCNTTDINLFNSSKMCSDTCDHPSWCWHISRSFSEERSHDFDSPSVHKSRRGSAPVSNEIASRGGLKGGSETGRRWSSEISGSSTTRRSSFGLLEPLLSVSRLDHTFTNHVRTMKYSQRRGSLPTDLYQPLESSYLLEHSSSDLLSVLIGPSGVLNTMQGIVRTFSPQECARRKSGGLEMLSGFWKSRTNDVGLVNKLTLRNQLLDARSSYRTGGENTDTTFSQRRGSVPLTLLGK
ncbi:uncharacterized protein [Parasteatoda tepidariorum]|uniref:uncharacterized protein isoform X2 n=1 Tax=Parasteatoda tepidariorum TaxID=114398 RepID=UPI0039BD79BB